MKSKRKIQTALLSVFVIALSACGVGDRLRYAIANNPIENSAQSIANGKSTYLNSCSACHGDDAKGNGPLAKTLTTKPKNLTESRAPEGVIAMRIANGVGNQMPAWKDSLSEQEIWELVHFIQSKRVPDTNGKRWWK